MSGFKEKIHELERQAYFKMHEHDDPFPLDGSEWARLIRERQYLEHHHHSGCEQYGDFLDRIHNRENGVLRHLRSAIEKALFHWFTKSRKITCNCQTLKEEMSCEEIAQARIAGVESRLTDLAEAEQHWLSHKVYSKPDHPGLLETDDIAKKELDMLPVYEDETDSTHGVIILPANVEEDGVKLLPGKVDAQMGSASPDAAADWEI